jgi:small GTP-binding protein
MGRESFFKLIIVGPPTVGKTSLVHRFSDDTFVQNRQTTLGCDFKMKVLEHAPVLSADTQAKASDPALREADAISESFVHGAMKRKAFTLQLWDIAGQDRTVSLVRSFFAGAMGVIVVCDAGRESSIAEALKWREIIDECGITFRGTDAAVPVVLAVNKCDLLPGEGKLKGAKQIAAANLGVFAPTELDRLCRENRMVGWVYCSARTGMQVDDVFRASIDAIVDTSIRVNKGGAGQPEAPEAPGTTRNLGERGARRKKEEGKCAC